MTRLLLKPLLSILILFALVSATGITLWLIKDLWIVVLCIIGFILLLSNLQKRNSK